TAKFLDGGAKAGIHFNLGKGHAILLGAGYELKTPRRPGWTGLYFAWLYMSGRSSSKRTSLLAAKALKSSSE
ncbi:MAG: hypothetical protein J6T02_02525, partial [Bacteroidales bacterium]|nr:hypothetical protein [Bacteroidales bacterium]